MLTYFTLSCLLSAMGSILYFIWLRKKLTALQAKTALLVIVLLSWAIPFMVPELPNYTKAITAGDIFYYENYNQWNVVNLDDESLQKCYDKAANSKDMCNCEVSQKANLVTFSPNPYYNFMTQCRAPFFFTLLIVGGVFLLEFLCKFGFLIYLAITGYKIRQNIDGTSFFLLYPRTNIELPVAAFTLWHNYIIWSPLLDELSPEDRKIVILHEVAHLRQRDTWQQILLHIAKLFWWMMPFFYLIRKELNQLNEFVADDFAVKKTGDSRHYAALLLQVKERQAAKKQVGFVCYFAQSLLKKRVVRLITDVPPKKLKPTAYLTFMLLLLAMFWGTAAVALPELQKQQLKLKEYELLKSENVKTGKSEFCKSCLVEKYKGTNNRIISH